MHDFELPTNIRQIGGVDDRLRIYVEDYAVSYMKRFAESGGESDRLAFLVGKYMVIDNQAYLFICGAVQGKFSVRDDGAETLTDESFDYAQSCLEKYFDGCEIVGWMQSQPGYGTRLNPVCGDYHMNNFIKPYHCLLVIDPAEKLESFYLWEKNMSEMSEAKGYFIFYNRNKGMQEYILDNRLTNIRDFTRGKGESVDGKSDSVTRERRVRETRGKNDKTPGGLLKSGSAEYKRLVNMLVSLSAVLFVICFIMGAGLIQNDNQITQIERDMSALNSAFGYVLGQVGQLSSQVQVLAQAQAQAVFAPAEAELPAGYAVPVDNRPDISQIETREVTVISAEGEHTSIAREPASSPSPPPAPELRVPPRQGIGLTHASAIAAGIITEEFDLYTVQRGDTLSGICYRFYGSTDLIEVVMEVNGITHPDMIFFGRVLLMPRLYHSVEYQDQDQDHETHEILENE